MLVSSAKRLNPHQLTCDAALQHLNVTKEAGLSAVEARQRQELFGANELGREHRRSAFLLLADQLRSVIVWLLIAAAVLAAFVGDIPDVIAIFCVLVINTAIGFFTSWNAVRSMEALFRVSAVLVRVKRDGRSVMLPVSELTCGDIVILEAGDVVPADLRLLEADSLHCDESALTGESVPVSKTTGALRLETQTADRLNMAFKGTAVTQGDGIGVVTAIGPETELGRIATLTQSAEAAVHPLEKRLDRLGRKLVVITIVLSTLIAVVGFLRGLELIDMAETAIALAVAAVPEGLPVVATLALARGMLRMARRNVLIDRLSAVETLGETTVILTDKTGTLTENRMSVTGFLFDGSNVHVGDIVKPAGLADQPVLRLALEIGALCNSAELPAKSTSSIQGIGDPMEVALLQVADIAGIRPDLDPESRPEIARFPYDPACKMMATVHQTDSGAFTAVKGAPEAVLQYSTHVLTGSGVQEFSEEGRQIWLRRVAASAGLGYRLIGLAYRQNSKAAASPFDDMVLVGMVTLLDPLRRDVPDAIADCLSAGVRVVMMTGDHIATATEIAGQAGLGADGEIIARSERDLEDLTAESVAPELQQQILQTDVFARVSPETKLKLVGLYQYAGHIVAMTGDGVNDAPALKKADIGIAMGIRGTQIARDAADVILKDDAFSSINNAMRQGRIIFDNIRRFVVYLMSCNFSEILVVGLAITAGLPSPLIPLQILFLNLVTDVFPAFALGLGEGDQSVMSRPPRNPAEPIIGRPQWTDIVAFGVFITFSTLGAFWTALTQMSLSAGEASTIAFLTLALSQLWHVFNMRSGSEKMFANNITKNPYVFAALVFCLGLLALAFLWPVSAELLGLSKLEWQSLLLAIGASFLPLVFGQIWLTLNIHLKTRSRPKQS